MNLAAPTDIQPSTPIGPGRCGCVCATDYLRPVSNAAELRRLVDKLWSYCDVLRDAEVSAIDYVEQLSFLLFLKMADERQNNPFNPNTVQLGPRTVHTAAWVGCGCWWWCERFAGHFRTLRLTTRGLERGRRRGLTRRRSLSMAHRHNAVTALPS